MQLITANVGGTTGAWDMLHRYGQSSGEKIRQKEKKQ